MKPTRDDFERLICTAVACVHREEPGLSVYVGRDDLLERALVFRFALHLDQLVSSERQEWEAGMQTATVDVELARVSGGEAKLERLNERGPNRSPDVVVHVRDSDLCNLLVVEVKCSASRDRARDVTKLQELLSRPRAYRHAARLVVDVSNPETPSVEWITAETQG